MEPIDIAVTSFHVARDKGGLYSDDAAMASAQEESDPLRVTAGTSRKDIVIAWTRRDRLD